MAGKAMRRWVVALTLFLGVAMVTANLYAIDCITYCEECIIIYFDCGACGGGNCEGWGAACGAYCFDCGQGEECVNLD